jgi:hypothetical protein
MTDVHEVYVDKRRWRVWPIVLLVLVALFGIALLVAMIMNIHGSITWPAGEVKFGFWPTTTTSASVPEITARTGRVATDIPLTPPPAPPAQQAQTETPPAAAPPAESNPAPAESAPPQQ